MTAKRGRMTDPERDLLDVRPTAEEMLARIRSETPSARGRLRIYLGMAPGVGKTYRMLEEGHRRVARGTDVVVGFVETHGRPRTADSSTASRSFRAGGSSTAASSSRRWTPTPILARDPTVALVDELAHTNIPGSARAKRWEDVEVIRDAGIHVVTTLNIQHLESVADAVATITGAPGQRAPPGRGAADAPTRSSSST